jgi:hypothetical protein
MNIKILNDAQNDIAKAMLFYENQKDKLGEYFLCQILNLYIFAMEFILKLKTILEFFQKGFHFQFTINLIKILSIFMQS